MLEIRIVSSVPALLGENPVWDVETERLYWLDVFGGLIYRSAVDGSELTVWDAGPVNALALRTGGGAILVAGRRIALFDFESCAREVIYESADAFNDGKVDRQGRFVTGAIAPGAHEASAERALAAETAPAGLYRIDPDLTTHVFGDGVAVSNGPSFSPDGRTLYWSDSGTREVYTWNYDPETGLATDRRRQLDFAADTPDGALAVPDGATVDAEGFRWVAAFFGHEIRRYAPDGSLDRRVQLPVHSPTSVSFGGPDLDVLFVTSLSAADFPGNPHRNGPLDGLVLAVHGLGVHGIPELRFAG